MPMIPQPLKFTWLSEAQSRERAAEFLARMQTRRTVRDYSTRPVPRELIDLAIAAAATAPSGANQQPWSFVAISDPAVKQKLRAAAEQEEREFYEQRAPAEWLAALEPLGTDWRKPHLTDAPVVIVVFEQAYGLRSGGERTKHYYVTESVGIAVGFLLAALHQAGLATLTHTPSPMKFLCELLGRPENERPFVVIPVGYPAEDAQVPTITKKPLDAVRTWI